MSDLPIRPEADMLILRPSRGKFIALGAVFVPLALLGLGLALGDLWYGWVFAGLFGIAATACFLQLSPRFAGMVLYPDRFEVQAGLKRQVYRWDEIADFFVGSVDRAPAVVFDRVDRQAAGPARELVGKVRGYDHWLPGTYGMTVEELARLMNEWRARAVAARRP